MNKKVIIFITIFIIIVIMGISMYNFRGKVSYSYDKSSLNSDKVSEKSNVDKLVSVFNKILNNVNDNSELIKNDEKKVEDKKDAKVVKKEGSKKANNTKTDNKNNESKKSSEIKSPVISEKPNDDTKIENKIKEEIVENKIKDVKEETVNVTITGKDTITEEEITDYKYGIKINNNITYEIITYSDGHTDKIKKSSSNKYDKSGFNASTNEMKSEGSSLLNKNNSIYNEVLNYTNEYREELGKQNLVLDNSLSLAATIRAMEMAYTNKFDHIRPNGTKCFTICYEVNTSCYAENIASGYANSKSVTTGWRNSLGHYNNMINESYTKLGVGMFQFDGVKYWVQLFR